MQNVLGKSLESEHTTVNIICNIQTIFPNAPPHPAIFGSDHNDQTLTRVVWCPLSCSCCHNYLYMCIWISILVGHIIIPNWALSNKKLSLLPNLVGWTLLYIEIEQSSYLSPQLSLKRQTSTWLEMSLVLKSSKPILVGCYFLER